MRKLSVALLCLVTLLTGCSSDDAFDVNQQQSSANAKPTYHWFGVKRSDAPTTRGVAQKMNLWGQNTELSVKFLNNPTDLAMLDKVKTYAKEWEKHANIKFNFVDRSEDAMIRIAFDWDNDWLIWSYTGSDAKVIRNQAEPTTCFGGLDEDYMSNEEIKGAVLRVFGQILGLEYEQRHIGWDESWWKKDKKGNYLAQTYWESEFSDYYEDFDWETIKTYVFDPLSGSNVIKSEAIDLESIMLYPYTRKETSQLFTNYELSAGDIAFIALLYPKTELPTLQEAWIDAGFFKWYNDTEKNYLNITPLGQKQESLPDVRDGEQLRKAEFMFFGYQGKTIPRFNTSNITHFKAMFYECRNITTIPEMDTSRGITFWQMFWNCTSLTEVPDMDTPRGQLFSHMFYGCSSLVKAPNLTTSIGFNFNSMFKGCKSLTFVPWYDTSGAVCLEAMFENCASLTSVPELNTSKSSNFGSMFTGANKIETISLTGFGESYNATVSGEHGGTLNCHISSPVLSLKSLEQLIDNTTGTKKMMNLYLSKELESKVPASLIEQATAKGFTFLFTL